MARRMWSGSPKKQPGCMAMSSRRQGAAAACPATREPVGVVALITLEFPAGHDRTQAGAGTGRRLPVVGKPAEDTPLTAAALVALADEAGFPAGTLNLVCASREQTPGVVDVWLNDARVRKITFTGSTPVGKHLARASAPALKRLSLELGGNALSSCLKTPTWTPRWKV